MILLALLLAAAAPAAPHDKPGSHDYPLIQRYPNQFIDNYQESDWDEADFSRSGKPPMTVRGHYIRISYAMPKGADAPSALEYARNYRNALTAAGWTFDTAGETQDLTAHLDKEGREIWAHLRYGDGHNGSSYLLVVEKTPMPVIISPNQPTPKPAGAKPDAKDAKDYPGIPRLPGQRIDNYDEKKFDDAEFEMASGPKHRVEGHKLHWHYQMEKDAKIFSGVHVVESYKAVLGAEGWSVLRAKNRIVTAVLRNNDKESWARIALSDGGTGMDLVVVEPAEFKQVVSASSLVEQLKREGHLAFPVHFDTGQDAIKDDSKPLIAQMVELLKADPSLKVEVQGHTDSTGDYDRNFALSEARAKAVMAALVAGGIDASRLTAKGYGHSQPIADNDTEGGRALNRRVELRKR